MRRLPAYRINIEQAGSLLSPRYLIRDSLNRYFNGTEWVGEPKNGALYDDLAEAIQKRDLLRRTMFHREFHADLLVAVNPDCQLNVDEIRAHLDHHTCIFLNQCGVDEPQHIDIAVEWASLRQTS